MDNPRNGNRSSTLLLNDFVTALHDIGLQPGDFIPKKEWEKAEYLSFGVTHPNSIRQYRHALITLDIVEQVGGRGRGNHLEGFRIRSLPEPGTLFPA